jgi:hypothetical protein
MTASLKSSDMEVTFNGISIESPMSLNFDSIHRFTTSTYHS